MKTTKILLKKTRINDWTSSKKWKENDTVKEWKAKWKTKRLTKRDLKNFSIKKGVLQPKHRLWLEMITNIYFRISNGIIKTMPIKFENLEKWTDRKIRWDVQVFIMNSHKPGLFFLINSWAKSEPEGHSLPSQNVPHPHKLYPDSTICQFTLGYLLRHKEKKCLNCDCNLHCVQLVRGGLPPLVQLLRLLLWAWPQGQQPGCPGVTRARVGAEIAAILVHSAGVSGSQGPGQCWGCW